MNDKTLDVLAIGNAIVDVIADSDDAFLDACGVAKGSMRLIDLEEAERLYGAMGPGRELSGGSAANTVAGLAALGLKAAFIGQLADDQLGQIFTHDIRSLGVRFDTPARSGIGATARCLVLVTPDAQRTMNTFLGAAQVLGPDAVDPGRIAEAMPLESVRIGFFAHAPRPCSSSSVSARRRPSRSGNPRSAPMKVIASRACIAG